MHIYTKIYNTLAEYDAVKATLPAPHVAYITENEKSWFVFDVCNDDLNKPFMDVMRTKNVVSADSTVLTNELALKPTNMERWFQSNQSITSLDELHWFRNATNLKNVAYYMKNLVSFSIPKSAQLCIVAECPVCVFARPTPIYNFTTLANSFNKLTILQELDVSKWNISNCTSLNATFLNDSALTNLDVSNWNTSNVINMNDTFNGCKSIIKLDVSNWDTSSVTTMANIFSNCTILEYLDVSDWDTSKVTNMNRTFNLCITILELDVSKWITSNVTNMGYMFCSCNTLKYLNVSNWDTAKVTDMLWMFSECRNLEQLDVSKWNTSNVTSMAATFRRCNKLKKIDVSNWDVSNVTSMSLMFNSCDVVEQLDVSNWNTSKVKNMDFLFYSCVCVPELDVKNWNVLSLTSAVDMFTKTQLTDYNLADWNSSNLTNMLNMFLACPKAEYIHLDGMDTSAVTNITGLFGSTGKLKRVSGEIDMTNVTTASYPVSYSGVQTLTFKNLGANSTLTSINMVCPHWGVNSIDIDDAYLSLIDSLYNKAVTNPNLTIKVSAATYGVLESNKTLDQSGVKSDLEMITTDKKFIITK